jgi:hypothetical protein
VVKDTEVSVVKDIEARLGKVSLKFNVFKA